MTKIFLFLLISCLPLFGHSQDWSGKFEQLGSELLATPNSYRTATGAPGKDYWQQRADYEIKAEIDDKTQILTGKETITYYNNSPHSLSYLWLQLDQNIFAPNSLTDLSQTGEIHDSIPAYFLPYSNIKIDEYQGGFTINEVKDSHGNPLPYVINYTMMRIDLPTPLLSGKTVSFSISWKYHQYERMMYNEGRGGYEYFPEDGNYVYTFGQWYPRMCVYDDFEGWQNKQFLGRGEFALTFGNFKVQLTVPNDHIVGATGWLQNPEDVLSPEQLSRLEKAKHSFDKPVMIVTEKEAIENEKKESRKTSTWIFHAEDVRDFAFAHSRKFIWDAMAVKIGNKTTMAMSLYPKEGNPLWGKESTLAVKNTLEVYSKRTIDYPYPVAYSVHTADIGMEYPMICFNFGRPENGKISKSLRSRMISVVVHEVGHNFFPMIVNSDERQWGWMDEGLNTFLEGETMRERYPELDFTQGLPEAITSYMKGDKTEMRPIMTTADNIPDRDYGPNAYSKPATGLTILRKTILDENLFDLAFKEYAQRWAFKHPKPADFFRSIENASGVDLDWFWRGWFYTTDYVDIAIDKVTWYQWSEEEELPVENKRRRNKKAKVGPKETEPNPDDFSGGPQPLILSETKTENYGEFRSTINDGKLIRNLKDKNIYEVTLKNEGGLVMPIILQWIYTDGTSDIEKLPAEIWRLNEHEVTKIFIKDKKVTKIIIDPKEETADVSLRNNVFPKLPESRFDRYKKLNH